MTTLAPILQRFFTDRLISQRHASPHTIDAYRATFRLLLTFAWQATDTAPSQLGLHQLDAELITRFLAHLETDRGNSASTRNARLAATDVERPRSGHGGSAWNASPVWARNPLMRSGRYWMRLSRFLTMAAR